MLTSSETVRVKPHNLTVLIRETIDIGELQDSLADYSPHLAVLLFGAIRMPSDGEPWNATMADRPLAVMACARLANLIDQDDEDNSEKQIELSRNAALKVARKIIKLDGHHDIMEAMERLGGMEQMQLVGSSSLTNLLDLCGDDWRPRFGGNLRNDIGQTPQVEILCTSMSRFVDMHRR